MFAIEREANARMSAVEREITARLDAYKEVNGRYPESLDSLSLTNSTLDREALATVQRFNYHRNDNGGFSLGYHGSNGWGADSWTFVTGSNEAQPSASANGDSPKR